MFKTNLSRSVFGCFIVAGLFVISACAGTGNGVAENAATHEATPTIEATATVAPTLTPEPTATVAIVLDPEVVGPVEMTGEEYKLLHTQNVVDKKGTTCPPEIFAARNELVKELRQRTMDKLAAETGEIAPENTFESYLAWLYQLKASGKLKGDAFWEYAGNMLLTNEEITKLAMAEGPINKSIEQVSNVTPGINFGTEDVSVTVTLPDGSTREQKIFNFAQGKVLAMVPVGLIPGDKLGRGITYVVIGDDNNIPFTVLSMNFGSFGDEINRDYFRNDNNVKNMPQKWQGYYIPNYKSVRGAQYHVADNFYNWGMATYDRSNMARVSGPSAFEDKYLRFAWVQQFSDWILDPNGVIGITGDLETIGEK